jgi:AcrR family transcriptional regulator
MTDPAKRTGAQTRAEAQRIALSLFSSKGYEATSLREIAEQLGISKAALYYHFPSKEAIVREGLSSRGDEAAELLAWAQTQAPGPALLETAVLRWVDSTSVEKLRGIRFINANPTLMRALRDSSGGIADNLSAVAQLVAGENADPERLLLVRTAFLSINAAVMAAAGTDIPDGDIVQSAHEIARALLNRLAEGQTVLTHPS